MPDHQLGSSALRRTLRLFDDLGRSLRTGVVAPGIAWAEVAPDIAFTEEFLGRFRQAVAEGAGAFDDYLMTTSYRDDQVTNVDW